MKTAREILADLGIDEHHPGPFSFQQLLDATQAALDSDPDKYSLESVRREQAKGEAFLMAPARISSATAGPDMRVLGPFYPGSTNNEEAPPF